MKSFRLKFIDVDESFVTSTVEAPIKGYMICRAPKGTTEATYFPYGNEKTINAMIGLPTANWPDLYEAVAFNTGYGLYISAPPGTAENYPSYYGGVYLTTKSMYNYWRVDDKDNPNYEVQVFPGYESAVYDADLKYDSVLSLPSINISDTAQSVIQITNLQASLMQKINYINFIAWNQNGTGFSEGEEMTYHLVNGLIYPVVDDADLEDQVGYYKLTNSGYTVVFGAKGEETDENGNTTYVGATNTASTRGVFHFNLLGLFNYAGNNNEAIITTTDEDGNTTTKISDDLQCFDAVLNPNGKHGQELVDLIALNGSAGNKFELSLTNGTSTKSWWCSPVKGLYERLYYRVNIKNDCFMRISQTSPNETPTSITISNIGYDKYLYDLNVKYILKEDFVSHSASATQDAYKGIDSIGGGVAGIKTKTKGQTVENFLTDLGASNADYIIDVISSKEERDWTEPFATNLHSLYQYDMNTGVWTDVTPDYKTKNVYVSGPLMNGKTAYSNDDNKGDGGYVNSWCTDSIWYISNTGKAGKYNHTSYMRTEGGTYPLQSDINYNTVTLSCKEKVYPGQYTSGGEWTGSLSDTGVDAAGSNIYWPNVLSSNDASFIQVVPVHTFDELNCINSKGFFSNEKLVDPIGPAQDVKTFTIKGQRTMTNAVESNIATGTLGCAWTKNALNGDSDTTVESVFAAAINDGIVEAQQNCYDDALVFMECSGQEVFKSKLMSLRTVYHDTCTIISPKMITKAEFNNPETITVAGRSTGTAQYVGEFKMYDTYTGKYYWCQPIGDVGLNLARIMEKKLGGIAPAGTNDSQGLGGVLSRAVLDKKWDFSDEALRIMDEKGINPITYDPTFGLMMQSQKTTQDPANKTDWSYLGHSMSFDLCKREIRDNVMVKQLHKRISDYWYNIRTKQVQAILDKRITGTDPIWDTATVDIASVNTPSTKAQRKFMITVKVKVYPYSDFVVLTFVTLAQE